MTAGKLWERSEIKAACCKSTGIYLETSSDCGTSSLKLYKDRVKKLSQIPLEWMILAWLHARSISTLIWRTVKIPEKSSTTGLCGLRPK